jgi:hypothetical protein
MSAPFNHPLLQSRYLGVVGDWHGNRAWARIAIKTLAKSSIKTVVQLGDFGLMGDIPRWNIFINKHLLENDMHLFVIPGNHENYNYVNDDTKFDIDEFGVRWIKTGSPDRESRIGLLPRGFKWVQHDKTFMALGGASSIDFTHRIKDKTWWEGENITESEADLIISELNGEHVDVMFTHDAPRDVMTLAAWSAKSAEWWELSEIAYAETSRARLDRVFRCAQPKLLMHGHWHLFVDEDGTFDSNWESDGTWSDEVVDVFDSRIIGLNMDNTIDNVSVLDVDKLEVTILQREISIDTGKPVGERRIFEG